MRRSLVTARRADAALLWFACAVAVCAGYYFAFGLIGAAIDGERTRAQALTTIALARARTLAQAPQLERAERAIEDRLRGYDIQADKATTVARFIRLAEQISKAQRVDLIGIDQRPQLASPAPRPSDEPGAFEAIPLDIVLNGSYTDLLAVIRGLARAPVIMQIEVAAIERKATASSGTSPPLSAHLHIVLERLAGIAIPPSTSSLPPQEMSTTHARLF